MRNPSTSTSSTSLQLGIQRTTVRRILSKRLKFHPFKVQLLNEYNCYLKSVIFSDEATFHVSGYVNRHNCWIWGTASPHAVSEKAAVALELIFDAHGLQVESLGHFFQRTYDCVTD
ncbi:hypothetical protein NPIL_671161 [Nephila pilipes]|uniref:Transposase n=1 Tax=Nephila pilipes TaxID=299642 RepID=A0A8X6PP76_NEPPI|nr:hypothetical protein NPIL_671161 [Nephila pilipes]